jgi:glycosyltransferase involved in cell wall biosynthesis
MTKVGLDTSALHPDFKEHAARGIGRYVSALTAYLSSQPTDPEVAYFDYTNFLLPDYLERALGCVPVGRQTLRQQLVYPLQLAGARTADLSLLHFPAHMDAPSWTSKPYVLTVLDLIPLVLADLYKADKSNLRFHFARWLELRAIKNARALIAISECTKRDLMNILNIPEEKIFVTPLGVDERFFTEVSPHKCIQIRKMLGLEEKAPLLLYVGGIDQRKNTSVLLSIFSEVMAHCREKNLPLPFLVMAGKIQNDRNFPRLQQEIKALGNEDRVVIPGYLPDSELLSLMRESAVFLFPSLYEGFGLPPLEAAASGVPVVSSHTSSLPEVLGDSALYFDPLDVQAGAKAVIQVLESPELSHELCVRGKERARLFTWQRTGELTVKVYEHVTKGLAAGVAKETVRTSRAA